MAHAVFNRKKQFLSPYIDGFVKGLTGLEEDDDNYKEVSNFVFANLINHNFATVDIIGVQNSYEKMADKFKVHGLGQRANRLLELVEKYLHSDTSHHSQLNVQWHVLLLLSNLSTNPTRVSDEALRALDTGVTSQPPEEIINWTEYLKEGWENFQPSSDKSDDECWSSSSEDEETVPPLARTQLSTAPDYVTKFGVVPHPSKWERTPLTPSRQQLLHTVLREGYRSEQWLKGHLQRPWWNNTSCQCQPQSNHLWAHMCDTWESVRHGDRDSVSRDSLPGPVTQTLSEYQVLKEVLWLLVVADIMETGIFYVNNQGQFCVKSKVSLPSTIPTSLQLSLQDLCPYLTMLHCLRRFVREVNEQQMSDTPPPFTYLAYSDALSKQLQELTKLVLSMETRLNKQDCKMTLVSVMAELSPEMNLLEYLYNIHIRAVTDCDSDPPWLCATRLLSVLYEALLEAVNQLYLETALHLFLHSFYVYLNIIDVWLSEGRLEDWRKEFLVIREGESLQVMPYVEKMKKCGVTPVSLLSKLVSVVSKAGHTMEIVSQLNKLTQLRTIVHNKGCLTKEFSENVFEEMLQWRNLELVDKVKSECNSLYESADSESDRETQELQLDKTAESDTELQKLFSPDNVSMGTGTPFPSLVGEGEEVRGEERNYFATLSAGQIFSQMQTSLTDNPLLREAIKYYLPDPLQRTQQSRPPSPTPPVSPVPSSCCQQPLSNGEHFLGLISMHSVLERQLDLIVSRHKRASLLVKETLCIDYSLPQHLALLRSVYFMENGILAQSFYSYLFKEILSNDCSISLSGQLQLIVEEFFPGFGTHFTVQMSGGQCDLSGDIHQAIQTISLDYRVDWPVSLVVTQESINSYNKVFRFLLHLKHSFWTLFNLRSSDLEEGENRLRVRRLQVLKLWMYHSTNTLHSYFMGLVLRSFSTKLDNKMEHAESIEEISQAHNKFLEEVKVHCLQDKKSSIETFIMKILRLCSNLAKLWEAEASHCLTDDDLNSLEEQYVQAYHTLEHCLGAFQEAAGTDHSLCELYEVFHDSAPEVGNIYN